jgi:putative transposase
MEVHHSSHGTYKTEYHVVWISKYRRRILKPGVAQYLTRVFRKMVRQWPGVEVVEQNIQVDHIHLVMVIPPKYAVSEVIGYWKSRSARNLRYKFRWLEKVYQKDNVVWSPGYFVSTVGLNEENIIKYVRYQQQQDSGQALLVF